MGPGIAAAIKDAAIASDCFAQALKPATAMTALALLEHGAKHGAKVAAGAIGGAILAKHEEAGPGVHNQWLSPTWLA